MLRIIDCYGRNVFFFFFVSNTYFTVWILHFSNVITRLSAHTTRKCSDRIYSLPWFLWHVRVFFIGFFTYFSGRFSKQTPSRHRSENAAYWWSNGVFPATAVVMFKGRRDVIPSQKVNVNNVNCFHVFFPPNTVTIIFPIRLILSDSLQLFGVLYYFRRFTFV